MSYQGRLYHWVLLGDRKLAHGIDPKSLLVKKKRTICQLDLNPEKERISYYKFDRVTAHPLCPICQASEKLVRQKEFTRSTDLLEGGL